MSTSMSTTVATWGALERDVEQSRKRIRYTMGISVLFHLLLLMSVVSYRVVESKAPVLTQIVLIDPSDLEPAAAAASTPAAAGAVSVKGVTRAVEQDAAFRRTQSRGDIAPQPQTDLAFADQLNARLSEMRNRKSTTVAGTSVAPVPSALLTAPAVVASSSAGRGGSPMALTREGPDQPALSPANGASLASGATMAPAQVRGERTMAPAPAPPGEVATQRTLAGASMAGPITDRAVISHTRPVYPDWAKREAVEGSVTLYFVVRPDGMVKENVLVQKTAGFEDFDENARAALRNWRFEPLRGGRIGEQWGTITFRFRLQGTD